MKVKLKIEKEFDVKYLLAEVGARYWEDSTVNGEEDTEGTLIPCRDGEYWKPLIEIETGIITNWNKGHVASIHYKCCDDGLYKLLDENKNEIKSIDGYVPKIMCPKENGYGDYVIMDIDRDGKIENWKADLSDFQDDEMSKEKQTNELRTTKALHIADVMQCFSFGFSDEYPSGYVSITKENAEKLQKHGWNVSFHTDYYLNTISAEIKGFSIGFCSWMDNLTAYIDNGEYQEIIKIKSREQLDKFLQLIESTMQFSNIA